MPKPTCPSLLLFAACLGASPLAAAPADPWTAALSGFQASLRPQLTLGRWLIKQRADHEVPGSGEGLTCLEYGRHTRDLPSFDPLAARRECLGDPLPDEAAFRGAWLSLVERIRRDGQAPVPVNPPVGSTYYQQAIGIGNTGGMGRTGETRLENGHWGDAAGLDLRLSDGGYQVVGGWIYTFRAHSYDLGGRTIVLAERAVYHADHQGRLVSVIRHGGELAPSGGAFMWPPMPSSMDGPNGTSGLHQIQWRQLVESWSRP